VGFSHEIQKSTKQKSSMTSLSVQFFVGSPDLGNMLLRFIKAKIKKHKENIIYSLIFVILFMSILYFYCTLGWMHSISMSIILYKLSSTSYEKNNSKRKIILYILNAIAILLLLSYLDKGYLTMLSLVTGTILGLSTAGIMLFNTRKFR
jgi:hypothetical protein